MMLSKEATSALISWKPVNDRIITTRFLSRHTKTTSVQVYAPTEDAEETEKDAFYNQLQDVISEVPRHDVTVLCGDFNAQIGANRQGLEHVIGPYGTGRHTTNNGEHLLLSATRMAYVLATRSLPTNRSIRKHGVNQMV